MKLTDNEIRDIVKLLEAGKPLPEKYRFLLFEEKREVELAWNGMTMMPLTLHWCFRLSGLRASRCHVAAAYQG